MTDVLITVDTELSASGYQKGWSPARNLESSIFGKCAAGAFGIEMQMEMMERHGLKGVFFIDPMPGLLYGQELVDRMVAPVLTRGHEVQLHIHTEWLEYLEREKAPVATRGRNIGDFSLADQTQLLKMAATMLERAGAPRPIAFRAGNYGASDDTLRALAAIGISYDSSFNPAYAGAPCTIDLPTNQIASTERHGIIEVPVAAIFALPGKVRPAQVCAMSGWEMTRAIKWAAAQKQPHFAIVTHSFELLSRDRSQPNHEVIRRFRTMCESIANNGALRSAGFGDIAPLTDTPGLTRLPANRVRTAMRVGAQAVQTLKYGRA